MLLPFCLVIVLSPAGAQSKNNCQNLFCHRVLSPFMVILQLCNNKLLFISLSLSLSNYNYLSLASNNVTLTYIV